MLINQIGVEEEPRVVTLRPGLRGEPDPASRVTLTDLLEAAWTLGPAPEPVEAASSVTTLEPPVEDGTSEPLRADVA